MKIVLIGQAAFGKAVAEAILQDGRDALGAVFCPPDSEGRPADPLKEAALSASVPVHQFVRLRSPAAIEQFRNVGAELCIMAFVTDIVPHEMISSPRRGTIQYHPSLLPRHRGPSSINWPIVFGETTTGLTIFWPDEGLDTGPILLQREMPIGPNDTVGSLYFQSLFPMGVESLIEAINLVREGRAPRIAQDESLATYEGWCRAQDAVIDWTKPAPAICNLIRGCDPQPGAHTTREGVRLQLYDAILREPHQDVAAGGEIVEIGPDSFRVAAPGGSVLVGRVRPAGGRKAAAGAYAQDAGLRVGERLGS